MTHKEERGMMMAAIVYTGHPKVGQCLRRERENLGPFEGNQLTALGPSFGSPVGRSQRM